jgi:CheY-like chemotaxis protein
MEREHHPGDASWPLILLIEDDWGDVILFRRALAKLGFQCDVRTASGVSEARTYMEHARALPVAAYHRLPQIIISDFKLGANTATEFLQWLRSQPDFAAIPVVMLSGVIAAINKADFAPLNVKHFVPKTADAAALGALLLPVLLSAGAERRKA